LVLACSKLAVKICRQKRKPIILDGAVQQNARESIQPKEKIIRAIPHNSNSDCKQHLLNIAVNAAENEPQG
jgi:ERCC4-related helicase